MTPNHHFLQREMIIKKEVSQNEKKDVTEALKEALKEDVKEDVKHAELREPPKVLAKERPEKGLDVSGFISSHGPFGPESRLTSGHYRKTQTERQWG